MKRIDFIIAYIMNGTYIYGTLLDRIFVNLIKYEKKE